MNPLEEQIWASVPDWPDYEVSNTGQVRSWKPLRNKAERPNEPRLLNQKTDRDGYKEVKLYSDGKSKSFKVHALVLRGFVGPPGPNIVCRHLDGSRSNNSLSNLKWGTPKENSEDTLVHGTRMKGEVINTSKLTEELVGAIKSSSDSLSSLGRHYGVTPTTIRNVKVGKTWQHTR